MKRYLKKSIPFLIIIALCFNLTACSKKKVDSTDESSGSETVQNSNASSSTESSDDSFTFSTTEGVSQNSGVTQNASGLKSLDGDDGNSEDDPGSSAATTLAESNTVSVTVPYGYSLSQIGDTLQAKGVCSKSDFLSTVNSYDFSYYPLVSQIPANSNRCYKLEGYLYPDTYYFYKNEKPQNVIGKMLRGAETYIGSKYNYSGMSTYQIITLASIIQKEVKTTDDMKIVSMIFHNRINTKMHLNADPTKNYIEYYVKPNLTGDINRYNSYYNTDKCIGLPAGPICSPGANALNAAANPDTSYADYYYFFTNKSGKLICSKTYDEHKQKWDEANNSSDTAQ